MVVWSAEKDQIILKGIFKFHDIKSSAPLLEYLAKEIGDDCTPKAVSHRLTNIRNGGTTARPRGNGSAASTPSSTPKKTAVVKTPKSRTKDSDKKNANLIGAKDQDGDADEFDSPSAARGKRKLNNASNPSYAESETDNENEQVSNAKRLKREPIHSDQESSYGYGFPADDDEV